MAASIAVAVMALTAATRNEESHVRGRVNRKKNNSVSDSRVASAYRSFFFVLVFPSLFRLPRFTLFRGVSRGIDQEG